MPANTNQARQTISQMRQIVGQLQRSEATNVRSAQRLAQDEKANQQVLSNARSPNYQATAAKEAQAANQLNQFANAENNAVSQLKQLDQLLSTLENQLR
ncbi:MAG TPA: hypothetical protein GXX50_01715 [Firmicutes bacterium]|uniref:hypothetical protein n=1 Tax=Gelria sp. Kuro-4 TaxID=2796927 RepID=UPI00198EAD06|nr:hypothetical protein [Gelria sp. Kuro-4]BCV25502.1 hypothetical protein kuro4_22750 [Gelria sp. Kuro-4]HHV56468.1 hypothetical protein [Bacillota bacterium]